MQKINNNYERDFHNCYNYIRWSDLQCSTAKYNHWHVMIKFVSSLGSSVAKADSVR